MERTSHTHFAVAVCFDSELVNSVVRFHLSGIVLPHPSVINHMIVSSVLVFLSGYARDSHGTSPL